MLDAAAWSVFQACATQWDVVVGLGGGGRTGLKYDRVRIVAEANGWALNEALLARIRRLEALSILDENRKREESVDGADGTVN